MNNFLSEKICTKINEFNHQAMKRNLLPVRISPFYRKKIAEEIGVLGNIEGPLSRCVLPTSEKIELRAPGEVPDFVEDRRNMPESASHTIVQKYKNRLLFLPNETCAAHCQYCFRTNVLSENNSAGQRPIKEKIDQLIMYLNEHPDVEEVILSGGDPMTVSAEQLEEILDRITIESQIKSVRAHTRTLVFAPHLLTNEKCRILAKHHVRVVHHIVHPYEICDQVRSKIRDMNNQGIRSYNQFPLLRRINDHILVVKQLLTELDDLGIRNISIFIPDPIDYSATFRIPLKRIFNIMDELNWSTSSWINSTRLVLDTVHGKVRREDLVRYDSNNGIAVFSREGKNITYIDLPQEMDNPGDPQIMLWKKIINS